jgi:hypothetical protein
MWIEGRGDWLNCEPQTGKDKSGKHEKDRQVCNPDSIDLLPSAPLTKVKSPIGTIRSAVSLISMPIMIAPPVIGRSPDAMPKSATTIARFAGGSMRP